MRQLHVAVLGCALLLVNADMVLGQDAVRLSSAKTLRCQFTASALGDMLQDAPRVSGTADSLELVFDQVDTGKRTARMIGNIGGEDVMVIKGPESLTFIELTGTGFVQVTAVYVAQRRDGHFKAVHSRHTAGFGGMPIPSQMYGSCRVLY